LIKKLTPRNIMAQYTLLALVALALAASVTADSVVQIDTFTADCDNCGMVGSFGQVSVQVCGRADSNPCCIANDLDNSNNNFEEGEQDEFGGPDEIGTCWLFDLGEVSASDDVSILVTHSGTDAVTLEWVQVLTDTDELYR